MNLPLPVVLASASPRRRELLRTLISEFEILPAEVDEMLQAWEDPRSATLRLAREKARIIADIRPSALVIGADTLVAIRDPEVWFILGKPTDPEDAARMLRVLSGRKNTVTTGVCLLDPQGEEAFAVHTEVVFRELSDAEIIAYAESGEPLDKAGAYAIQGAAASFIVRIEGSRTNVVGLPMEELEIRLGKYENRPGGANAPGPVEE